MIILIGGDRRTEYLARYLTESGHTVRRYSGSPEPDSGAVILPFPCVRAGKITGTDIPPEELEARFSESAIFFGDFRREDERHIDYAHREELLIKNARITAEGAVAEAMRATDGILFGAHAAVIGYGRLGKQLCLLLAALGCTVTAAARRSESRAEAEMYGIRTSDTADTDKLLASADIIFNTVAHPIITRRSFALIGGGVPVFELASAPGGFEADSERIIRLPGLPGAYAPKAAGIAIGETVTELMNERGLCL